MSERKVQSKHIPADYDHRVLAALKKEQPKSSKQKGKKKLETVRVMLPFNVCCSNCNSYMYRGRKFNAKKETGLDSDYLGTEVIRFHVKCDVCSNEIIFRTDPASSGFVMVSGARENKTTVGSFNPLADVVEKDDLPKDGLDAMAALEARALETKKEMELLHSLQKEMERSQNREKAIKASRDIVMNPTMMVSNDIDDEEEQMAAFREKKRLRELQAELNSNLLETTKVHEGEELETTLHLSKKVKKKSTSLVPYDDSDDEED